MLKESKCIPMKDPILIVGAARSGTSLVAGIINKCGAWYDCKSSVEPNKFNPKGYFESSMLFADFRGAMIFNERPEEKKGSLSDKNFNAEKNELKNRYRIPGDRPWFIKMPEIVACKGQVDWPLWDKYFPEAKWVIVRRNLTDIFSSHAEKYGHIREGTEQVLSEMDNLRTHLELTGRKYVDIWPFRSMAEGPGNFKNMIETLELEWHEEAVEEFIDPNLQHHNHSNTLNHKT
jgi:hypothetical protein